MKLGRLTLLAIILCTLSLMVFGVGKIYAEEAKSSTEDNKDKIDDLQEEIDKLTKKIGELQGRAKTLTNEIDYMNSQISLTELKVRNSTSKITQTAQEIEELSDSIDDLSGRIGKLQDAIEFQKRVLASRLRERYKDQEASPIVVLFGLNTLNNLINKTEYLKTMETQDNKLVKEMDVTRTAFNRQKSLFETKKIEEESLKVKLEQEKANLDNYKSTLEQQKSEKNKLLELTQNDEAKYQEMLEDARRELDQITRAVGVLKHQSGEKVEQGEVIGIQGNTGFSSGDHLHFGVYKYSSFADIDGWNWYYSNYVDPAKVLESKTVSWSTGCESSGQRKVGKGDWEWPMSNPTISQGFGHTCWSNIYYGGKAHPAYDMYGAYGSPVYAVADGEAYFCRNCLGDGGNGVFIFHDDGYMTLYWHLR